MRRSKRRACAQVVALGQDLVDHGAADVAHAQAENVQRLDFGFEERLVQGLQGLALVLGIDDDADVALVEPWLMARMLMPLRPRVPKARPAMPLCWRMPSPTRATMANPDSTTSGPMRPSCWSAPNSSFNAFLAPWASASATAMEMACSEEP